MRFFGYPRATHIQRPRNDVASHNDRTRKEKRNSPKYAPQGKFFGIPRARATLDRTRPMKHNASINQQDLGAKDLSKLVEVSIVYVSFDETTLQDKWPNPTALSLNRT